MTDATEFGTPPHYLMREGGISIAYQRHEGKGDLPGVVFLCGFNSDMTGTKAESLHHFCAARGQSFVRFDYQGHGKSSGRFIEGTVSQWLEDARAVLDQLTTGPQILVGSSMGGWISLLLAVAHPERVAGLVGIAPAADFINELMWPQLPQVVRDTIMSEGASDLPSLYDTGTHTVTRALIEDGRKHRLLDKPIPVTCPVRILQGTADPDVPWKHAVRIAEALDSEDVTVTLVKNGDHRLSSPENLVRLQGLVADLSSQAPD